MFTSFILCSIFIQIFTRVVMFFFCIVCIIYSGDNCVKINTSTEKGAEVRTNNSTMTCSCEFFLSLHRPGVRWRDNQEAEFKISTRLINIECATEHLQHFRLFALNSCRLKKKTTELICFWKISNQYKIVTQMTYEPYVKNLI